MFMFQPAPVVEVSPSNDQSDVIEVIGTRPNQTQKIDRRSYRVQQTPHSAQKDAIQLLRGLPTVTISADGQVMLLGNGNVQIFVDGRPYPGDVAQFLRTLHGGDIESIEVITNPSAQYSAEGTGGIVNFILRKKRSGGASANVTADVSSFGRARVDGVYKFRQDKWTYELEAHGAKGRSSPATYFIRRSVEEVPGGAPTENTEDGRTSIRDTIGELVSKIIYEIDQKTVVSAKLDGAGNRSITTRKADFEGSTPDFEPFSGRWRANNSSSTLIAELILDHKGSDEGETLNASVRAYGKPSARERTTADYSGGDSIAADRRQELIGGFGQVDWKKPVGKNQTLSLGGSWNYRKLSEDYLFASSGPTEEERFDHFTAGHENLAAYATFQQPVAGWKFMPGLRIERNNRRISSPSTPDVRISRTNLFPTVHVEHRLNKWFNLNLSYSKRIDRAPAELLRPYLILENLITGGQGNPQLKDQSTDAYEIGLHYNHNKFDANLTFYDRKTSELWSKDYGVIDGVNVYTWINSGNRRSRGAELDINAPIARNLKGSVSLNLFQEMVPVELQSGMKDSTFRYSVNASLEWRGMDRGKIAGDVVQLQFINTSAYREFELRNSASNWLSASFTHSFSPFVSVTAAADYAATTRRRLLAPLVQEHGVERKPVELKLKLSKNFGKG